MRLRSHDETGPRPSRGPVVKLLTGNLDRAVVVASIVHPDIRTGLVDRLLVLAEQEHLQAVLVITKVDLLEDRAPAVRYHRLYNSLGYPTLMTSTRSNEGLAELRQMLSAGRSALCGHSGVGKSTLLGALEPELAPATGEVSLANDKGQHTTTSVRLYRLASGGEIFDLPGLKLAPLQVDPAELGRLFPDFVGVRCRFRDCLHCEEPACGVKLGVEQGWIDSERYQSYLRILDCPD